jgi:hypothetical protein
MNITCAYCHIKGHHIKKCEELAEKNRRRAHYENSAKRQKIAVVEQPLKQHKSTNLFVDLYSSEEEEDDCCDKWNRRGVTAVSVKRVSREDEERGGYESPIDENYVPPVNLAALEGMRQMGLYLQTKYKGMSWAEMEYATDSDDDE